MGQVKSSSKTYISGLPLILASIHHVTHVLSSPVTSTPWHPCWTSVFYLARPTLIYIIVFGRKLTLFQRHPTFPLKRPAFFYTYFEFEKMRSMRSAQCQVELRRLGNQLPVLCKANSLCTIVKCCVFCLFAKLRLSSGGTGIKISRVIVTRAKSE